MRQLPIPLVVALGAVVGILIRWAAFGSIDGFSQETLTVLINAIGCLLMGLFVRRSWNAGLHTAATVGFCGGLTTFSTFALDAALYFDSARWAAGLTYVAITVAASAVAYGLGRQISAVSA